MKKKKLQCSIPTLLLAGVLCLTLAACGAKQSSDMLASDTDSAASAALPVKAMNTLSDGTLYELRVSVADGSAFDLSETEKEIKISVVLAK